MDDMMVIQLISSYRVPWFQYPIIYDVRARPKKVASPTGTKGNISVRGEGSYLIKLYFSAGLFWRRN